MVNWPNRQHGQHLGRGNFVEFFFPTKAVSCRMGFPMEFVMMKPLQVLTGEERMGWDKVMKCVG